MMTNSVPSRAAIVDYSHPIAFIAVSYLIPSSYKTNNFFLYHKTISSLGKTSLKYRLSCQQSIVKLG